MTEPITTTTVTTIATPPSVGAIASSQAIQITSAGQNSQIANAVNWNIDQSGNLNILDTNGDLVGTFAAGQWTTVQVVG